MEHSKVKNTLAVSETFLSVQGEGHTMGRLSYFIRLAGCNLMCGGKGTEKDGKLHDGATWRCDSIEVWMKGKSMTFGEIVTQMGGDKFISNLRAGHHLIFTGGEPMIQQSNILEFLYYLINDRDVKGLIAEIETNGTIMPEFSIRFQIKYWNVSPKLSNSGESFDKRFNGSTINFISRETKNPMFKFVISNANDLLEIERDYLPHIESRQQIWLMPAADTRAELDRLSEYVVNACKRHGYNYSHRLQLSIWDKTVGV